MSESRPTKPAPDDTKGWRRWVSPAINVLVVFGLLAAVSLLPPDTSLQEMRRVGTLRACVPADYPPLVIGGAGERRGIEVDLLALAAERMGLRLVLNVSNTMGRDINPRNWRLTRAQCNVIAGGVLATNTTRSYLDTTQPHLEAGWVALDANYEGELEGATVAVFPGFSGFDRIALSQFLRNRDVTIRIVNSGAALADAIRDGEVDFGITESIGGRQIAGNNDFRIRWLSDAFEPVPVTFGLWKGDLTIKRALNDALAALEAEGATEALLASYELMDIEESLDDEPVDETVETLVDDNPPGAQ